MRIDDEVKKYLLLRLKILEDRIRACSALTADPESVKRARRELGLTGAGGALNDIREICRDLTEDPDQQPEKFFIRSRG